MSEPKEGCVSLEDVEESTFIRFSQFAYTGDYIAADPEILLDSSTIAISPSKLAPPIDTFLAADKVEELPDQPAPTIAHPDDEAEQPRDVENLNFHTSKVKKKKNKASLSTGWADSFDDVKPFPEESASSSRRNELWKLFDRIVYAVPNPWFHPRKNREPCEDYKDVFLCHARLYVFAEQWDIAPLRMLSLNKLHKTLSVFTLYHERVGDLVALMRYSYANTVHLSSSPDDPLRSLVIHYAACVVENLVRSSEFKALLKEPGELASDLVVKMINRLD